MDTCDASFQILKESAFPQLKFENTLVVQRLFGDSELDLDMHTGRLPFEAFIKMVKSFKSHNMGEKMDRMFRIIDEDGNGMLSFEEIFNLCNRSLASF